MKLITFRDGAAARPGVVLADGAWLDLPAADPALPARWNELFAPPAWERVRRLAADPPAAAVRRDPEPALLLPPVPEPSKIIAVGLNYRDHAAEQDKPLPPKPLLFAKAPSCLQAPYGPIVLDGGDLDQVDCEAELAVVVGRRGRAIAREQAREHIAGYMCFNDVSDRKAQYSDKQWFRGKSIDTGGPCGPWIVTPDELPDLALGLRVTQTLSGRPMQNGTTADLIFPPDELIAYASRHMTLLPGDIISTGTPAGVGVFRDPPVFVRPGDEVVIEIERMGALRNRVLDRWPV